MTPLWTMSRGRGTAAIEIAPRRRVRATFSLEHPLASHLRARCPDGRLHFLLFLGRRQHGGHAQGLDPQLTAPAGRVVEVLVFLLLDLLVSGLERIPLLTLRLLGDFVNQLPV